MRGRTLAVFGGLAVAAAIGAVFARRSHRHRSVAEPFGELPSGPHWRSRTVLADDGVELWVEQTTAPGKLTVVFCHGFTLDRRMWCHQVRELPELIEAPLAMVCYDHRSHGRSGHASRQSSTIEQLGRDLGAVLAATAPDGPVVLAGHSMGAMTIMELAEQR